MFVNKSVDIKKGEFNKNLYIRVNRGESDCGILTPSEAAELVQLINDNCFPWVKLNYTKLVNTSTKTEGEEYYIKINTKEALHLIGENIEVYHDMYNGIRLVNDYRQCINLANQALEDNLRLNFYKRAKE